MTARDGQGYAVQSNPAAPTSGAGGPGGMGGPGGGGGGGAGGGSYGAYCFGNNLLRKVGSVTFAKQRNSLGGTGGDGPSISNHHGAPGTSKLSVGCLTD
ncbi:hypothetical protein DFR33_11358 [Bradymonas sediminis]|nr:hypothetical protein DFR33_11358 [Bradymonas sediminis]